MVASSSPDTFLISCWVMVEPPYMSPPGRKKLRTAPSVRLISTPLCEKKRTSSMAIKAFISVSGNSLYSAHIRFSLPCRVTIVSSRPVSGSIQLMVVLRLLSNLRLSSPS